MWVPTQGEAVLMYARFLKARHGAAASKFARETASKLQDEDDLAGYQNLECCRRRRGPTCHLASATIARQKHSCVIRRNVRYWHKADIRSLHCTCPLLTQSRHSTLQVRKLNRYDAPS